MSDETEIIKERANLAEIVREYVQLKQIGRHFKGLCPFHQEKTPSFIVSPDKGIWHCFGCGSGGDAFTFIQRMEKVEFPDALKILAERTGVELKKNWSERSPENRQKDRLYELLDLAAKFFHEILVHQPVGLKAKEYLQQRGVKEETMRLFMLGYAPKSWDNLQQFLRHKGFNPREMVAAGVAGESTSGKIYDRFRGRIIFPIEDMHSRTVAFGGRIAPWYATGEEGKYINSPETTFYAKRRTVYNLNRAKNFLRDPSPCIVVEGYMDIVLMVQAGHQNVVASSGTAFTTEALQQLSRFTNTLHFAFDADEAGLKAAIAATETSLKAGLKVATLVFPSGSDPADLVLSDPRGLAKIISAPRSLIAMLIEKISSGPEANTEKYLTALLPFVAQVRNPVQQGEMVREICRTLSVPESTIIAQLDELARSQLIPPPTSNNQITDESNKRTIITPEQQLLGMFIAYPAVRELILKALPENLISAQPNRELYSFINQLAGADNRSIFTLSADQLIDNLPKEAIPLAEGLRQVSEEILSSSSREVSEETQTLLGIVKRRFLEAKLKRLQQEMASDSQTEKSGLMQQFHETTKELAQAAP